jgi:hypothetical protein
MEAAAARRIRCIRNGDAAVGLFQRGCIVDPITGHADDVAVPLEDIHNLKLVLRKHLGEAIRLLDRLRQLLRWLGRRGSENTGIEDQGAHPQVLGCFLGDR